MLTPARSANSFLELIFDGERKEFVVMLFASERIPKGREVIVDYGPDYWKAMLPAIIKEHEKASSAVQGSSSSSSSRQNQKKRGRGS